MHDIASERWWLPGQPLNSSSQCHRHPATCNITKEDDFFILKGRVLQIVLFSLWQCWECYWKYLAKDNAVMLRYKHRLHWQIKTRGYFWRRCRCLIINNITLQIYIYLKGILECGEQCEPGHWPKCQQLLNAKQSHMVCSVCAVCHAIATQAIAATLVEPLYIVCTLWDVR